MIYLQHIYAESGLPTPLHVSLSGEDATWLRRQVIDELTYLWPGVKITPSIDPSPSYPLQTLALYAYRTTQTSLKTRITWGYATVRLKPMGIAFYCVDKRHFAAMSPQAYPAWARHERLFGRIDHWMRKNPSLWRRIASL